MLSSSSSSSSSSSPLLRNAEALLWKEAEPPSPADTWRNLTCGCWETNPRRFRPVGRSGACLTSLPTYGWRAGGANGGVNSSPPYAGACSHSLSSHTPPPHTLPLLTPPPHPPTHSPSPFPCKKSALYLAYAFMSDIDESPPTAPSDSVAEQMSGSVRCSTLRERGFCFLPLLGADQTQKATQLRI